MRYFQYYIAFFLFAVLWASCSSEEWVEYPDELVAALFEPSIEASAGTRATGNTWGTADEVGIFMLATSGSTGTTLPGLAGNGSATALAITGNSRYKATPNAGDNTKATLTPYNASINTLYYPLNDNTVKFIAYSPYTASLKSGYIYPVDVTTDQSVAANQEKVDLIYHDNPAITGKRTSPKVALNFTHQLTKVVINLKRGSGMENVDMTTLTAKLQGFPTTADFALSDGTLSNQDEENDITPLKITGTGGTTASLYKAQAIVVPHGDYDTDGFGGRKLNFVVAGIDQSYSIENTESFDKNKVYEYNLIMTRTTIELESVTILDWVDSGFTGGMGGNNVLNTSREELYFSKEGIDKYSLIIKTNLDEPTIKYSSDPANDNAGGANWINHTNLVKLGTANGLTVYELQLAVQGGAVSNETGYIHISSAPLTRLVKVNRSKEDAKTMPWVDIQQPSNCYIIHPYGRGIAIPVSRANTFSESADGGSVTAISGAFTTELLWSDVIGSNGSPICSDGNIAMIQTFGSGYSGYIIVHPGNIEGNAVITVKVGDEIKWSWHIWVTSYDPDTAKQYTYNGRVFTDRNLGATHPVGYGDLQFNKVETQGLLYQWGRKDPFPSSSTVLGTTEATLYDTSGQRSGTSLSADGAVAIAATVKSPDMYIRNSDWGDDSDVYYNWCASRNHYLWEEEVTQAKTIYDPCPVGWRVPPATRNENSYWTSPWYGLGSLGFGFDSIGEVLGYYPAPSTRRGDTGEFASRARVLYWSASPLNDPIDSGASIYGLVQLSIGLRSTLQEPQGVSTFARSHGCYIRCVKI